MSAGLHHESGNVLSWSICISQTWASLTSTGDHILYVLKSPVPEVIRPAGVPLKACLLQWCCSVGLSCPKWWVITCYIKHTSVKMHLILFRIRNGYTIWLLSFGSGHYRDTEHNPEGLWGTGLIVPLPTCSFRLKDSLLKQHDSTYRTDLIVVLESKHSELSLNNTGSRVNLLSK